MNSLVKKVLRIIISKWVLDDIEARFTHPYWRRRETVLVNSQRIKSISLSEKTEKSSSRPPFKFVNEKKILDTLRRAGVKTILDVGCGRGNLVFYLEKFGYDVQGVTINPEEVLQAESSRIVLGDIQADISKLPLPVGSLDAVISFDCMEHLEAPLSGLRNINRLLKPGGLFISYIPPSRWTECDYHLIVYTPRQYRWLLNLAGFDLIRKSGRHFFSKKGVTYYAIKKVEGQPLYPGVLE